MRRLKELLVQSFLPSCLSRQIMCGVIKKDPSFLFSHPEYVLTTDQLRRWEDYHTRAVLGEPVAYIFHRQEFWGREFYVDPRVLIPRPESEELVRQGLNFIRPNFHHRRSLNVLELGTGSGAILISLTRELIHAMGFNQAKTRCAFIATDASELALQVARQNFRQHRVNQLIRMIQGDLFTPIIGEKFDLILANLPYLPSAEAHLNRFEPQQALNGGEKGSELIDRLLSEYQTHLKTNGCLVFEDYGGRVTVLESGCS